MTRPKKSHTSAAAAATTSSARTNNHSRQPPDVEASGALTNNQTQQQPQQINNPYSSSSSGSHHYPHNVLPTYHPLNVLKRGGYIAGAAYGLYKLEAPSAILQSPRVRHEWFKIGLAGSIAILGLKAYVELVAGKWQRRTVDYENFKQTTHAVLVLICATSAAFHVALWPHYGVASCLVLFLLGVILLNACLLLPTYLQNLISVVFMTFFLQEYK